MTKPPLKACEISLIIGGHKRTYRLDGFDITRTPAGIEIKGRADKTNLKVQSSNPRSCEVSVTVDGEERRFILRSRNVSEVLELLEVQELAWNLAVEDCKGAVGDPMTLVLSSKAYLEALAPRVIPLLQEPADGGGPLTDGEYWLLAQGDPSLVIETYNELVNMETLVMHGQYLQAQAKAKMLAELEQVFTETGGPL